MKKIFVVIGVLVVLIIGLVCVYMFTNDNLKFKREYESLNGKKSDSGKSYLNVNIPKNNNVTYLDIDEVLDFIDSGTGILYFGFPECPWCRNAVPVLIDKAVENEVNIYYYNALSIRDEKKLEDGKVVTTKKGDKKYYELVDKLSDYLDAYEGLNDESIKRLYFPTAVFVMGGKIVGLHTGTVESQTNPYKELTDKQKKELGKIYQTNIDKIYGICDESC